MRVFLRGCLVWFVGFPLSVIVASGFLTAPIWATAPRPLDSAIAMLGSAAPVVAAFSVLPAVLTRASGRILHYVGSGMLTGAWCGALALSLYFILFVVFLGQESVQVLREGSLSAEAQSAIAAYAATLAGAWLWTILAGSIGGFVFGAFAARPARFSS